jgi:alpha-L-rhamnosidase
VRKRLIGLVVVSLVGTFLTATPPAVAGGDGPADLRTDFRTDPLGIDNRTPSLSWRTPVDGRDQRQTSYQVRVATRPDRLARPDLWDSGRVRTADQTGVTYHGDALRSRQQAFWQVRTWDERGRVSPWSRVARWEMALLEQADWQADWIGHSDYAPPEPHPVTVMLDQPQDARYVKLDVTSLGLAIKEGWPYPVSRLQLAEISVADGDTVVSEGAVVTASEAYIAQGSWEPRFVTDGRLTTEAPPLGYTSFERQDPDVSAAPIWLKLDLGAVKHVDRVLLYPRTEFLTADGRTPNFPVDFSVSTSADDASYTKVADVTGQQPPEPLKRAPADLPIFAKQFEVGKHVRSARLYATGLGINVASVNGQPVGSSVLDPANTDYKQRVEYATYDVTRMLRTGRNAIGVQLGNGNYNVPATPGRYVKFAGSQGPPKLLAQLEITYADGTRQVVASDNQWRTTLGPTTFSNWYGGEDFDARRVQAGWDRPHGDLSAWGTAVELGAPTPQTVLGARSAPPIEIVDQFRTKKITQPKPGVYVVDLGTNFAGWPLLEVRGPAGTTITMRPAEVLAADGTVSQHTTGSPIFDRFTLAGTGSTETWHPRFSYHGFRYLQLEGLLSAPTFDTVTGLVLRAANETAGSFTSSNPLINSIHGIIDRAIQSNMYSVLTDCPHREKLGWLEEYHLVFGSVSRNYDVAAYYRALVRTITEAQTPDGLVPDIAPEYTVFSGGFRDDPNWGGAIVLAPWELYRAYGDIGTLRTYYPNMVRYLDYLAGKADEDILAYGLGDWIAFDQSTPLGVTATFAYHRLAAAMARIATVLGKDADAARWTALTSRIGEAFNREFHHGNTYGSGSQASDAFALDLGVVPEASRQAVLDHLIASIEEKGWHLTVGEIALPSVFRVLSAAGRDDVIYRIATQTGNPSYGYQVMHGATSLTENWDGPTSGNSQNHFMLGAIDEWFTSGLAGIRQAPDSIGYRELEIRPAVIGDLTSADGRYTTPYGEVRSRWQRTGETVKLEVTIPPGSTATVWIPGRPKVEVGSGRWTFTGEVDS